MTVMKRRARDRARMAVLEEIEDEPPARVEAPAAAAPAGASDSDSDDEPPPLESAAAQLEALNLRRRVAERVNAARADSSAPSGSASTGAARASSAPSGSGPSAKPPASATRKSPPAAGMKKGFFDAPRPKRATAKPDEPEMVFLKGKKSAVAGGAAIPDFMRVEVEGSESAAKMKKELLETLKPDKQTVDEVMGNQALMSGFDDPEVMAAVEDVARAIPKTWPNTPATRKSCAFTSRWRGWSGRGWRRRETTPRAACRYYYFRRLRAMHLMTTATPRFPSRRTRRRRERRLPLALALCRPSCIPSCATRVRRTSKRTPPRCASRSLMEPPLRQLRRSPPSPASPRRRSCRPRRRSRARRAAGCIVAALRKRACACVSQKTFCARDRKHNAPPLSAAQATPFRTASDVIGPGRVTANVCSNASEVNTSHATITPASFAATARIVHRRSALSRGNPPRRESTSVATSATGTRRPGSIETSSSVFRNDSPSNSNTITSPVVVPTSTCALPSREHELQHAASAHLRDAGAVAGNDAVRVDARVSVFGEGVVVQALVPVLVEEVHALDRADHEERRRAKGHRLDLGRGAVPAFRQYGQLLRARAREQRLQRHHQSLRVVHVRKRGRARGEVVRQQAGGTPRQSRAYTARRRTWETTRLSTSCAWPRARAVGGTGEEIAYALKKT